MMKKLLYIVTLMLIALPAQSQSALSNADTAALIIGRHYEITDYDAIPKDSMLFIESHIVYQDQPKDTLLMRRWYVWPNRFRLEITRQDSLLTGYRNDGKDEYMKYDYRKDDWAPVNINYYYNLLRLSRTPIPMGSQRRRAALRRRHDLSRAPRKQRVCDDARHV